MSIIELLRYILKYVIESLEYIFWRVYFYGRGKVAEVMPPPDPGKILVVQLDSIGDVIMSTPAIKSLKKRYPGSSVEVLTLPHTAELLRSDPHVDDIMTGTVNFWRLPGSLGNAIRTIRRLKERKYDICLDLGGTFGSVVWALLADARFTSGPDRPLKRGIFESGTAVFYDKASAVRQKHLVKRYLEVVCSVGCVIPEIREELYLTEHAREESDSFLQENGLNSKGYAVIHPGAKWPPKRWPEKNFADMVKMLYERIGLVSVLAGSPSDSNMLKRIKEGSGVEHTVIAEGLSLMGLAAVIARAKVFVGNDSGPAHMASAAGTFLVVLFGPTDPEVSAPVTKDMTVFHDRISCWPCTMYFRRDRCEKGSNVCLESISPQDVFRAVEERVKG